MEGFDHPLANAALREVVDLHRFFEAWLGGTVQNSADGLSRLERALGPDFTMVTPGGSRLKRSDVIGWLQGAQGTRGEPGPFRISILEPELLLVRPPFVMVGYVEEQTAGGVLTRRRSTAMFRAGAENNGEVQWIALHETWIDPNQ